MAKAVAATSRSRGKTTAASAGASRAGEAAEAGPGGFGEPESGGELGGGGELEGVVVSPDLVFSTEGKTPGGEKRTIPFSLDGDTYEIVLPRKAEAALALLVEAAARRASQADVLYAGQRFLEKVIAPESLVRLQARLDDDGDPFDIGDLYGILQKVAEKITDELRQVGGRRARDRRR